MTLNIVVGLQYPLSQFLNLTTLINIHIFIMQSSYQTVWMLMVVVLVVMFMIVMIVVVMGL
jgi:hypothetical protein